MPARLRHPRMVMSAFSLIVATSLACATNPATGKKEFSLMSEAQEIQLGQEMDRAGQARDGRLRRRRASALCLRRRACGWRARPSARTSRGTSRSSTNPRSTRSPCPGGYIYVTRGILAFLNDEEQLAGVLGHEIGHVTARHSAQQYTKATSAGVGLTLLSIFVPEAQPLPGRGRNRAGPPVPQARPRRRAAGRPAGRAVHRQDRMGSARASPACCERWQRLDEASGSRRACRTCSRPTRRRRIASQQVLAFIQQNPVAVGTSGRGTDESRLPAQRRRHHLRRQPERRHRPRQPVPASRCCGSR